jgi:hypothetical protein
MLIKLVVASYALLLEILLWLVLAAASITGYEVTMPIMHSVGLIPEHEVAWKIIGALAFPVIAFLFLAVIMGPMLVIVDIRDAIRNIEAKARSNVVGGQAISWPHPERKEPT